MFTYIELIKDGKVNDDLSMEDFNRALSFNEIRVIEAAESGDDLADNYGPFNIKYDKMLSYVIVYDTETNNPVCSSGLQKTSKNTGRILSRYFRYKNYRPGKWYPDDIEDYIMLNHYLTNYKDIPILYNSREKNNLYQKRLKKYTKEYKDFQLYPGLLELMFKNNFQHVFYTSDLPNAEEIIKKELTYVQS